MQFWDESSAATKALLVFAAATLVGVILLGCILVGGLILGGAGTGPAATATPTATTVLAVVPLPTATPLPAIVIANDDTPIHAGPGIAYERIGTLQRGQSAQTLGSSEDQAWWLIKIPGTAEVQGWVEAARVTAQNVDGLPTFPPPPQPTATPLPETPIADWQAEYFANRDLQGPPVLTRTDLHIDFDWGFGSPAPELPPDNFSTRWTLMRNLPAGVYRFSLQVDDGARIWVDDGLVLDAWQEGTSRGLIVDVNLVRGPHSIRVEYFEGTGPALARLDIQHLDQFPDWMGEYFDGVELSGAPVVVRNDEAIDFNWGSASPAPGLPPDGYAVRWTRQSFLEEGNYRFRVDLEGGVRLWLDGRLLIDDWSSTVPRVLEVESGAIAGGDHDLRVEYLESGGSGRISVAWQLVGGAPVAAIDGPGQGVVGEPVAFSGRRSFAAPGHQLVLYVWDFADGTQVDGVDVSKVWSDPGVYEVVLAVLDDQNLEGVASQEIRIVEPQEAWTPTPPPLPSATPSPTAETGTLPPVAVIDGPLQGQTGVAVTFTGSRSSGGRPIVRYEWAFGDGATAQGATVSHVYSGVGSFEVTLRVVDDGGREGISRVQIAIRDGTGQATATPTPTPTPDGTETPSPTPTYPDLEGITWVLTDRPDGTPIIEGTEINALFVAGRLTGDAGCNTYSADYVTDGSSLTITNLAKSTRDCDDAIDAQEQQYLDTLRAATGYLVQVPELVIEGSGGTLLAFIIAEQWSP